MSDLHADSSDSCLPGEDGRAPRRRTHGRTEAEAEDVDDGRTTADYRQGPKAVAPPMTSLAAVLPLLLLLVAVGPAPASGAFMARLPLRITSVLPSGQHPTGSSAGSAGAPAQISGRDAITVTFSRAVIALGADFTAQALPAAMVPFTLLTDVAGVRVPGRLRWVTTFTARFDPSMDWPTDLTITLAPNPALVAFDGTALGVGVAAAFTRTFTTPALAVYTPSVTSEMARRRTGGTWVSRIEAGDGGTPAAAEEVPPDGVISLSFSRDVDPQLVGANLQLRPEGGSAAAAASLRLSTQACPPRRWGGTPSSAASAACVAVTVSGGSLAVNTRYRLVLPAGSRYHPLCGATAAESAFLLSGLVPFSFPFLQGLAVPAERWQQLRPSYRRWRLWVRHGLSPATTAAMLASAISIAPPVANFALTVPDSSSLRLEGDWHPGTTYTVSAASCATCLDGFGLPMVATASLFQTAPRPQLFLEAGTYQHKTPNFVDGAPISWSVLAQGASNCLSGRPGEPCPASAPPKYFEAFAVLDTTASVVGALASTCNRHHHFPSANAPTARPVRAPMTDSLQELSMPTAAVLAPTGLFVHTRWDGIAGGRRTKTSAMAGHADVSATLLLSADASTLVAWVQRASTGTNLVGATVTVYSKMGYGECSTTSIRPMGTSTTGTNGVASVTLQAQGSSRYSPVVWAVVSHGGKLNVIPNVPWLRSSGSSSSSTERARGALITDRGLYKVGDTVSVKGVLRSVTGSNLGIPTGQYQLRVRWKAGASVVSTNIAVNQTLGTFSMHLSVPADAEYKDTQLEVVMMGSYQHVAATTITIADPRPPTVQLQLKTSSLVMNPSRSMPLAIETQTYTGSPVAGAQVKLTWRLQRTLGRGSGQATDLSALLPESESRVDPDFPTTGTLTVVTDSSGHVLHPFEVEGLANNTMHGDTVLLEATWVGPTRELITERLTLTLSGSEQELAISCTPEFREILPGFQFGLLADVRTVVGQQPLMSRPVTVRLVQWTDGARLSVAANGAPSFNGASVINTCTMSSDGGTSVGCPTVLPSVSGKFALVACTVDETGRSVCASALLGKTDSEWTEQPLASFNSIVSMVPDQQQYTLGSRPQFHFFNPFAQARALVYWGNILGTRSMTTLGMAPGLSTITLPAIGTECDGGCRVAIVLTAPRQASSLAASLMNVTKSPLFDWRGAQSITSRLTLSVPNAARDLRVSISVDNAIERPGVTTGFTLNVTDSAGQPTAAEVCVFVVDTAFLDLKAHPAISLRDRFQINMLSGGDVRTSTSVENYASAAGYTAVKDKLVTLVNKEPFVRLSNEQAWPLVPSGNLIERSQSAYLASLESWITSQGCQYCGQGVMMSRMSDTMLESAPMAAMEMTAADAPAASRSTYAGPVPAPAAGSVPTTAGAPPTAPIKIPVRSAFETTPLFAPSLAVPSTGLLRVRLQLPDNVGTFSLRAYAIATANRFGHADASQVVRNPLSLSASTPRIVRVGDVFECGFTVTAADPGFRGAVTVSALVRSGGMELRVAMGGTHTVQIASAGPHEVLFAFLVPQIQEDAEIHFTATAGVGADAFTVTIPVLSPQGPVCVATSMAVDGTVAGQPWLEGLVLPEAIPGSGSLTITAGVGNLPAVQELATALMQTLAYPNGLDLVSALTPVAMLAPYQLSGAAPASAMASSAAQRLTSAFAVLGRFTDAQGLRYSERKPVGGGPGSPYINTALNAWAAYVAQRLAAAPVTLTPAQATLAGQWRSALITGLVREAELAAHRGRSFSSWDLLARARLVLGAGSSWLPAATSASISATLSMANLLAHAHDAAGCSDYCKVAAATALLGSNPTHPSALALLGGVFSRLRVSSRTAYISAGDRGHSADIRTNALFLSAITLVTRARSEERFPTLLVQKLAGHVAQGDAASQRWGGGALDGASRGFALSDYDSWSSSSTPNLQLVVASGAVSLLTAHFSAGRDTGTVTSATNWSALASPPPPMGFRATGSGQVAVAAAMTFVPRQLFATAVYRGLFVERVIQHIDPISGLPVGRPLRAARLGDIVAVTLQLTTPDDLRDVMLEDWAAGGLEPLDPNVGNSATATLNRNSDCAPPAARPVGGGGGPPPSLHIDYGMYLHWFSCTSFVRQTRPDRVSYVSRWVSAGTHSVTYSAMAATSGTWVHPPAQASVALQPELMGMSAAGSFRVSRLGLSDSERYHLRNISTRTDQNAF